MRPSSSGSVEAVVIGGSAGSVELLLKILPQLPADFAPAVLVCIHAAANTTQGLVALLAERTELPVSEAEDKQWVEPGQICLAPGGYHLLVERDRSLSLSLDPPILHARPSIDVLFESAADCYQNRLVSLLLTGASADGARGSLRVRQQGGRVLVQEPASAAVATMPQALLALLKPDAILHPNEMAPLLSRLGSSQVNAVQP